MDINPNVLRHFSLFVVEHRPAKLGDRCGDFIYTEDWLYCNTLEPLLSNCHHQSYYLLMPAIITTRRMDNIYCLAPSSLVLFGPMTFSGVFLIFRFTIAHSRGSWPSTVIDKVDSIRCYALETIISNDFLHTFSAPPWSSMASISPFSYNWHCVPGC